MSLASSRLVSIFQNGILAKNLAAKLFVCQIHNCTVYDLPHVSLYHLWPFEHLHNEVLCFRTYSPTREGEVLMAVWPQSSFWPFNIYGELLLEFLLYLPLALYALVERSSNRKYVVGLSSIFVTLLILAHCTCMLSYLWISSFYPSAEETEMDKCP
jgi:hypothetical protein